MRKVTLLQETEAAFIERGKTLARDADAGLYPEGRSIISTEEPVLNIVGKLFLLPESGQFELHLEEDRYIAGTARREAVEQALQGTLVGGQCHVTIQIGTGDTPHALLSCQP